MIPKGVMSACKGIAILGLSLIFLSGCITGKKIDKFVSGQYGNQLPHVSKPGNNNITVTSSVPAPFSQISNTVTTTDHFLPLLFYWQGDHKHTCTLNPGIFVNKFTNTISGEARRRLASKLGDEKLELNIEQLPHAFTLGEKWHAVWVIYLIHWEKTYVRPDTSALVVDYKLMQDNNVVKSGTISVPNGQREARLGMFQSWKNASSSQIAAYNYEILKMSRECIDEVAKAL